LLLYILGVQRFADYIKQDITSVPWWFRILFILINTSIVGKKTYKKGLIKSFLAFVVTAFTSFIFITIVLVITNIWINITELFSGIIICFVATITYKVIINYNQYNKSSLIRYAIKGNSEKAKKLILKGVDVNMKDTKDGNTALMMAALHGRTEIAKYLLGKGANVNAKDNYGSTALINAARFGKMEIVKLLIENGADVNVCGGVTNDTALWYAKDSNSLLFEDEDKQIEKLLLAKGAKTRRILLFEKESLYFSSNCNHIWILPPSGSRCNFCRKVDDYAKGCRKCGICICDECWCSGWGEKFKSLPD
jgi:hypothetical protein